MKKPHEHECSHLLKAVLLTEELGRRRTRFPDFPLESKVLDDLSRALVHSPQILLQTIAKSALILCQAGSAAIGLVKENESGRSFSWIASDGEWKPQLDKPIAWEDHPSSLALERETPQLFAHPEKHFPQLQAGDFPMCEALVVPFSNDKDISGALWAMSHRAECHFDGEDVRLLTSLSRYASHACQLMKSSKDQKQHDIESKAAVEANAKFSAFFEQGSYFAGVMSLDGTLLEANRLSLEECGFTRSEVIGKKFWDCGWWNRSPELQERIRHAIQQAAQGNTFRKESPYFVADGSMRLVDLVIAPVKDQRGNVIYIAPTGTDITKRKVDQQIKARLAAIVENSDDAIISKDLNSIITSWNAGATKLFGYTEQEVLGRSIVLLIPPERIDEEPGILDRIRRGERIDHYETIRRCKDGTLIEISLTVSPLKDAEGKIVGASKIARDITDRKRAERALMAADRQKNEFLATLAHELRNPLAPIRNALNVLQLTRGDALSADRVHDMMERQVNQLVRLVDDLLEISRITTGKIELRPELVDIRAVVRNAIETSRPLIDSGGHRFEVQLPDSPLFVEGDPVRLSQIIANLLNNAAKYTKPGGKIKVNVSQYDQKVMISVRDNGIGISPELLPHVLEMFIQSDRAKRQSKGGLGIGLALANRLVEMHGGRLEARSQGEGCGSEFIVHLPISTKQFQLKEQIDYWNSQSNDGKAQKILIVDDNQDVASSLAILLRVLGKEVIIAHSGQAALQIFEEFRPSVVFLDLGMPEMDGFEVARRFRQLPEFQGVTLIALTGWGQEDDRRRTQEAGFDHHVVKPMNLEKLQLLLAAP